MNYGYGITRLWHGLFQEKIEGVFKYYNCIQPRQWIIRTHSGNKVSFSFFHVQSNNNYSEFLKINIPYSLIMSKIL